MFAPALCNAFCCLYLSWDVAHLNLPTWSVHPACRIKSSCVRDLHVQKMVEIHAASRSFFFARQPQPDNSQQASKRNLESVGAVPASQSLNSKAEVTGKEVGAQESQAQHHHH